MHTPRAAIAWQLWRPYRWWFAAAVGWFAVVAIACRLMPEGQIFDAATWYLVSPLAVMALGLLTVFTYNNSVELTVRESGFPTRMLTLPVTASTLAGWPMLYGALTLVAAWLAVAGLILLPRGIEVALWWPALFAAGFLAWFQVICWSSFAWTWLRTAGAIGLLGAYVGAFVVGAIWRTPEWLLSAAIAIQLPVAFVVAVGAVARARRGEIYEPKRSSTDSTEQLHERPPQLARFSSPRRAQRWFEWRLNGWGLLYACGVLLFGYVVVYEIASLSEPFDTRRAGRAFLLIMLETPLLLALMVGAVLGRFGVGRGSYGIPSFVATRPIGAGTFVASKLRVAAVSIVLTTAATWVGYAMLMIATGTESEPAYWWHAIVAAHSPAQVVLIVALSCIGAMIVTWGLAVHGIWLLLTGRQWPQVVAATIYLPLFFGALFGYLWLLAHPHQMELAVSALPWAAVVAAVVKLALAVWLAGVLLRRRLIAQGVLKQAGAVWIAAAVVFVAAAWWLVPGEWMSRHASAACVVLLLPILGIEMAPLALAWNRHR